LHKFSNIYLGKDVEAACYKSIFSVAKQLFLLRAAKISLGNMSWVEGFTRLCSIEKGQIAFDLDEYVRRLVAASAGRLNEHALRERYKEFQDRAVDSDFRQLINAHDLVSLLSWYARQYLHVEGHISNERALQRGLLTSVEGATLKLTALFGALDNWAHVGP
jgi:hypothetical protein